MVGARSRTKIKRLQFSSRSRSRGEGSPRGACLPRKSQLVRVRFVASRSESENRAECDAEIVMRAVVEIDFIADVQSQADWSQVPLQSSSGIENATYVIGAQVVGAAEERSQGGRSAVQTEIDEATLQRYERLNGVVANIDLRSKLAVKHAQVRARKRHRARAGIRESFGKGLIEVVAHLPLKLNFLVRLKAHPSAD